MVNVLSKRIEAAVESILNNEALSAGLDDPAAQVLITWGIDLAKQIAARTGDLDDQAAEAVLYQPMRALRKLLRATCQWALNPTDEHLQTVIAQFPEVYGPQSSSATQQPAPTALTHTAPDAAQRIQQLRAWIEEQTGTNPSIS